MQTSTTSKWARNRNLKEQPRLSNCDTNILQWSHPFPSIQKCDFFMSSTCFMHTLFPSTLKMQPGHGFRAHSRGLVGCHGRGEAEDHYECKGEDILHQEWRYLNLFKLTPRCNCPIMTTEMISRKATESENGTKKKR